MFLANSFAVTRIRTNPSTLIFLSQVIKLLYESLYKFLKRSKPENENMTTSSETAETDSMKNAKTAVANVVREEDNDVTLTTDQHVVMGNEQNVVDPLRNLDDPAM